LHQRPVVHVISVYAPPSPPGWNRQKLKVATKPKRSGELGPRQTREPLGKSGRAGKSLKKPRQQTPADVVRSRTRGAGAWGAGLPSAPSREHPPAAGGRGGRPRVRRPS